MKRSLIIWNQYLGRADCHYMRRWVLNLGICSIRLHQWFSGDDRRAFHDHGWHFLSVILWGEMVDVNPAGRERLTPLDVSLRSALHQHTVETNGCWTFLICGPELREWGFYVRRLTGIDRFVKASRYFREAGQHPCQSA